MPLLLAALIIGLYVWASTRSAQSSGDHTVTKATGGNVNPNTSSSSPLTPTQKVVSYIPSDIGPVPVVVDTQTTGNLMNIAQVWRGGVSHFVATYRDGTQAEVNANGVQIGAWS